MSTSNTVGRGAFHALKLVLEFLFCTVFLFFLVLLLRSCLILPSFCLLIQVNDCAYLNENKRGGKLEIDNQSFMPEMADWARNKRSQMVNYDLMMTFTS